MNNNYAVDEEDTVTCEVCDKVSHIDDGCYYSEASIFECDSCLGQRTREAAWDVGTIYKSYPSLHKVEQAQRNDPVEFYLACKNGEEII